MGFPRRNDAVNSPNRRLNPRQRHTRRRRCAGSVQFAVVAVLLLVLAAPIVSGGAVGAEQVAVDDQDTQFVAGTQLQAWWGQRGDVESAVEQLGGVPQCPEIVNSRLESEFLRSEDSLLASCSSDAVDYDVAVLFRTSQELVAPTREQTTRICLSGACSAWFTKAVGASWLPECLYRQSQTSFRSLVETLLRIREDVIIAGEAVAVAPNASVFREIYQLNQLANLMNGKTHGFDGVSEAETPVMQIARKLSPQEDFGSAGTDGNPSLSTAVAASSSGNSGAPSNAGSSNNPSSPGSAAIPTGSSSSSSSSNNSPNSLSSSSSSSSSSRPSSTSSSGSSNSVGDMWTNGSLNMTDTAGFTGSGIGPHASTTATTTELGTSYAFLVGAWVLFNGSYFFLMRRK